ncbi:MAG TPA: polyprenyl synthetase family protein [Planctomycetes bacterium]|nr:polyprenyl synthetase family protein [Planctomycetota bacterium]HIL51619.1 polyprenyl synthetase family protein [Planctomycetota bacterium]
MSPARGRLAELSAPVHDGLAEMRACQLEQLTEDSAAVGDMTDHISRFRGKQLRGTLVMLVGRAHGAYTSEHPTVAAVVEMIHLATLVHDDVLDGATVRRRVACVNERWDNQVAVLLGDFLYARAFSLSTTLSSRLCSRLLSDTTRKLCVGEIEQAARRYDFEMTQEGYERIAGAKTASLYSAACELGARYPGGNEELGASMGAFGWEIGLAFQIIDDCLDVCGDQAVVGKNVGNDVDDGKVTLPVLRTYAAADHQERAAIRDAYTLPDLPDRLGRLREVADLEPGVEYALARAGDLVRGALRRLEPLAEGPAKRSLEQLGEFILERKW